MKCPSCGEANDNGMQFCINCGSPLAAAAAPPPIPVQGQYSSPSEDMSMSQSSLSASQAMVLVCTVCNKSDPLNGQFCVFCGGKTVAGPAPRSIPPFAGGPISGGLSADYHRLSMEVPRTTAPATLSKKGGGSGSAIAIILLAAVIGAALGGGTVYLKRESLIDNVLHSWWPAESILVYTDVPQGKIRIEDIKHKNLILGSTSADGTFVYPNLQAGAYSLQLSDASGKQQITQEFRINTGEPLVLGYPQRLKFQ